MSQRTRTRRFIQHPAALKANTPFTHGGRLYGGFWERLERQRRASLRINAEAIAEVDYNALFLRLACALGGSPVLSDTDPYSIVPGLEQHREGVKRAVATLLFAPGLKRWPEEAAKGLPDGYSVTMMREAVSNRKLQRGT